MFIPNNGPAEKVYYDSLSVLQKLSKEREPDWGIAIEHKGETTDIGKGLLQTAAQSRFNIASLTNDPYQVTRQLQHIGSGFNSRAIALFAYSLHHFSKAELEKSLDALRNATHGGAVVAVDYSLNGLPDHTIKTAISSQTELQRIRAYGDFDSWLQSHDSFESETVANIMRDVGYTNVASQDLETGRTITVGLQDNHLDVEELLQN